MSINDRKLLIQGAEGDNRAIRKLWEIWSPKITVFLRGTVAPGDVEDLTQDIMLKIFRSLDRYNPVYAPATWIYTIADRTRTDWLRRESRALKTVPDSLDVEEKISTMPGPYDDPETQYIRREAAQRVERFLDLQDKTDRQILYLYSVEGLSGRAIARVMETPAETIRYRLKILKLQLKEELSE